MRSIDGHSLIFFRIKSNSSIVRVLPLTSPLESQHILHLALQFSVNKIPHPLNSIFFPSPSKNKNYT